MRGQRFLTKYLDLTKDAILNKVHAVLNCLKKWTLIYVILEQIMFINLTLSFIQQFSRQT